MRGLQRYTVKDVVFLAILAAALTIAGMLTMPLVMTVKLIVENRDIKGIKVVFEDNPRMAV